MPFAIKGPTRLRYEVEGTGTPLLLHHGFTDFLEEWYIEGYVDALKSDFQLIMIEPRGHGQSDKPHDPAEYCLDIFVADVVAVLDRVGVDQVNMLGYSMGGRIAFATAKYAPERLSSLTVGGATPSLGRQKSLHGIKGDDPDAFIVALENLTGEKLRSEIRKSILNSDTRAYAALMNAPSEPISEVLEMIDVPTLLYVGSEDFLRDEMVQCAAEIGHAKFVEISELNHAGAFTNSAAVVPHLTKFLGQLC